MRYASRGLTRSRTACQCKTASANPPLPPDISSHSDDWDRMELHPYRETVSFILLISLIFNSTHVTCQKLHTPQEITATSLVLLNKHTICAQVPADQPLILVKSAIHHEAERNAIRSTWAHYAYTRYQIRTLFVLGSSQDAFVMKEILREESRHQDLLVSFVNDDYYNLTLKTMFTLFWVSVYCDDHWVLYVDDDSLVNPDRLNKHVSSSYNTDSIECLVLKQKPVIRNNASKWFMPTSAWNQTLYPDYCLGVGFLMPPRIAGKLHASAASHQTQPKLWIDDVFVTGIATRAAGIHLFNPGLFLCCGSRLVTKARYKAQFLFGEIKPSSDLTRLWQSVTGIAPIPISTQNLDLLPHSMSGVSCPKNSSPLLPFFLILFVAAIVVTTAFFGCKRSVSIVYKPLKTFSSSA